MSQTPKLSDVIESAIGERLENFYTAIPAEVLSYSPTTRRANIRIQVMNGFEDSTGKKNWLLPTIQQVLVIFPGGHTSGGTYHGITHPINPGDRVLYIVSSLPLHVWQTRGYDNTDIDPILRNNLASGFALPGIHTTVEGVPEAPTDATVIHGDMTKIGGVSADEFVALKKDLQNLRTALQTAVIALGAGGAASVITAADTLASGGSIPGGTPGTWPVGSTKVKVK